MSSQTVYRDFLVSSVFLATTACTTVGPDFETPEAELNEAWTTQDHEVPDSAVDAGEWWSVFNDTVLDQLVESAYRQNLSLQISGLRIFEARAQLGIAIGQQYPQSQQLNGALTGVGLSENSANFSSGIDDTYMQAGVGFDAAWELDFWGRYRRGVESASANLGASIADYDNALVSLTSEVARVYTGLRTTQERLVIARDNAETQRRSYKIADVRYRNGAVSGLDPAQALSLLRTTESQIPVLESQLRQARHALSVLLGMPPGNLDDILAGKEVIPEPPVQLDVGLPAELLRRRPDIRRAELQAAAQSALVGVARADLFPRFALVGSIGLLTSDTGGSSLSDMTNSDSLAYDFGPSVSWPLLNYGRLKNSVRVQDARLEELLFNYRNTVLQAAREVEDGIADYEGSRKEAGFLVEAVKAAQRAVELALVQYREGAVDYQRVLDTQRALLSTQEQQVGARSNVVLALVSTYKALGGGWEIRAGNPFVADQVQQQMEERTDWGRLLDSEQVPAELPAVPPTGSAQPVLNAPDW